MRTTILISLVILSLIATGCSGEAEVTLINQTSRYVSGDIDGVRFGVNPNGSAKRTVDVGSTFSNSSDVEIEALYHASSESFSPVEFRKPFRDEYKAGREYTVELFITARGELTFRRMDDGSIGTLVAP